MRMTASNLLPRRATVNTRSHSHARFRFLFALDADPFEDQFEKAAQAKKARVAKNEKNRLRNIAVATGQKPASTVTPSVANARKQAEQKSTLEKAILSTKVRTSVCVCVRARMHTC